MRVNVSAVKAFQHCQLDWYWRFCLRRVPRAAPAIPLSVGSCFHAYAEQRSLGFSHDESLIAFTATRDAFLSDPSPDEWQRKFIDEITRLGGLLAHYTERFVPEDTLMVEEPIETALSGGLHTLIGRPDRVIRFAGKWWHMQYRTLSDRTPIGVYIKSRERDLHELAYAWLIAGKFRLSPDEYGGSYFNIVRKLSTKAIHERPLEAFVQELIPLDWSQVLTAIDDIGCIAFEMDRVMSNLSPIQNRDADLNRFGNVLSPYYEARAGRISIHDDAHFMTAPDPYDIPEEALVDL